jgi:hypothetical protein
MATFPALRPASLSVLPGTFPATIGETQSGRTTIVRHGSAETGIQWATEFVGLTYAQWVLVKDHFAAQGTVESFLFDTVTLASKHTPAGYRWWYVAEPTVTDVYKEFFNIQCTFRCDLAVAPLVPAGGEIYFLRGGAAAYAPAPTSPPAAPSLAVSGLANEVTTDGFVEVSGVASGSSWQYSTDSGSTWMSGQGAGFRLPPADYSAGQVRVRQTNAGGTSASSQNAGAFTVAPPGSVAIAFTAAAGATTTGTVTLPLVGDLIWIRLGHPSWFTLYASAAAAAADAARPPLTKPEEGRGICCDPRLLAGDARLAGLHLNPFENFKNEENPATKIYPWKHRNEDTVSRDYRIILQFRT